MIGPWPRLETMGLPPMLGPAMLCPRLPHREGIMGYGSSWKRNGFCCAGSGIPFADGPRGPDQARVMCHPMTAAVAPAVLRSLRRRRPPGGPVGITPDATGGCTVPCILQVHESCGALSRKEPLRRFG